MNNWQIKDIDDVFEDPINLGIEVYSAMSEDDENVSADKNEEIVSEDSDDNLESRETTSDNPEEDLPETEDASSKQTPKEESVEDKIIDSKPQDESQKIESTSTDEEDQPSEIIEEVTTTAEASKVEVASESDKETPQQKTNETIDGSKEDTAKADETEEAESEIQLDPEEAAVIAMQTRIVQATYSDMRNDLPRFQVGDTISIGYRIIEGSRSRIQTFEGVVIKISSGHGLSKTFTVRKISSGVGVERIFPLHSPNIESVKVLKEGKVRRAKLYYLRKRKGKATRIKERT